MRDTPLTREELARVIEGRGAARRVPCAIQPWVPAGAFGERAGEVQAILDAYPCDVEVIRLRVPEVFDAPAEDPGYRWMNTANP